MTNPELTISDDPALVQDHPEVQRLIPTGSDWAVIDWPLPPDELDTAILPPTAHAICTALLGCGTLALRWFQDETTPLGQHEIIAAPERTLIQRVASSLLTPGNLHQVDVLATTDILSATALFAWGGWTLGAQAALVFDPEIADLDAVAAQLRHGLDWRRQEWLPGVKLLFGSGHDGGCAVIAANRKTDLTQVLSLLRWPEGQDGQDA